MELTSAAFWDVSMSELDAQVHRDFIIRRVFDFGLMVDVAAVMNNYSKEEIIKSLQTAPYLDKKTFSFACACYKLKPETFRCHSKL